MRSIHWVIFLLYYYYYYYYYHYRCWAFRINFHWNSLTVTILVLTGNKEREKTWTNEWMKGEGLTKAPLVGSLRGHEVFTAPPWSQSRALRPRRIAAWTCRSITFPRNAYKILLPRSHSLIIPTRTFCLFSAFCILQFALLRIAQLCVCVCALLFNPVSHILFSHFRFSVYSRFAHPHHV